MMCSLKGLSMVNPNISEMKLVGGVNPNKILFEEHVSEPKIRIMPIESLKLKTKRKMRLCHFDTAPSFFLSLQNYKCWMVIAKINHQED